jgi:hypothetical protein
VNIYTKLEITCEVSGLPKNEIGRYGLTFSTMLIRLKNTESIFRYGKTNDKEMCAEQRI